MKHFQDVMNAEQWNPKVNKRSNENDEKENTVLRNDSEHMSIEDHFLKKDELHVTKPKTASSKAYKSKKRPGRSKLWMLLLSGFLISIISGAAMAFWLLQTDNTSGISSEAHNIDERVTAFDDTPDALLREEDQEYISDANVVPGNEEDILHNELYADMADNDEISGDDVYADDDLSDFARDNIYEQLYADTAEIDNMLDEFAGDSSFNEDSAMEPIIREKKDTPKETGSITIKKEYTGDDKIKAAISAIKENVNRKDNAINKEAVETPVVPESGNKVEHTPGRIVAAALSEKKQIETVTPHSREQAVKNQIVYASLKKKFSEEEKPVSREKAEKEKTSYITKDPGDTIIQSNNARAQKADIKVIKTVKEARVYSDDGEQALENAKPVEQSSKDIFQPIIIPIKETIEKPVVMTSIQEKPSPHKTDAKALKTGISPFLKEMSVNYEDQFDTNHNNWPEYDNGSASAAIAKGKYHIENKTRTGSHTLLHPVGVPIDMDIMIDVSISSVRSSGETSYGFVFGAKDTRNSYSFLVRNGHLYSIEKMSDGITTEVKGGQIDNIFIRDAQKSMKIVKRKNKVRFYIDGLLIDEISDIDYFGDKMGFLVRGKVKMSVDSTYTQIRFQKQ